MIRVDELGQNAIFVVFSAIWVAGGVALAIRTYMKQRAYLRRFVQRYPFFTGELPRDVPPTWSPSSIGVRLIGQRQNDPEVEALRREISRRNRQMIYWIFGFPVLVISVIALLIASGVVHFLP